MTSQRDLERTLDTFFATGADEVADRVIDDVLLTIEHTPQRRALRVPRRFSDMSSFLKLAATAAAVVLAIGAMSIFVLSNRAGGPGGSPAPSVSIAPSSTATPSSSPATAQSPTASPISTADWVPYSSTRYGYTIAHPPTWSAVSATHDWVLNTDAGKTTTLAADQFIDKAATFQILMSAFAADVPAGMSDDQWLAAYFAKADAGLGDCGVTISALVSTTVDGLPGRIRDSVACSDSQAFVFVDGRIHVFSIWRANQEPLLRAFLSTVKFQASTPFGSPGPS